MFVACQDIYICERLAHQVNVKVAPNGIVILLTCVKMLIYNYFNYQLSSYLISMAE